MADITLESVTKDSKLLAAALAFAKTEFNSENILFYCAKAEPKVLYEKYVSTEAAAQVNLPGAIADPMHALAKANDWLEPSLEEASGRRQGQRR
jgi:hypothetical protein